MDTYLLEKSRVTHQSKNESNFHIFYQLCASKDIEINNDFLNTEDVFFERCEESLKDALFFEEKFGDCNIKFNNSIAKQHTDFSQSENVKNVIRNKRKESYNKIIQSLREIGIQDIDFIEGILLSIIYIGSIKFRINSVRLEVVRDCFFKKVCSLLNVEEEELENILTVHKLRVKNEDILVHNNENDAYVLRNSIARLLYLNIFNFIIKKINESLGSCEGRSISILDIFGFEVFDYNSLDQLCINWANEKIQNEFINRIFRDKQDMYKNEGMAWRTIDFETNSSCILEIEQRCGLMDLIDEESFSGWGSIDNLGTKIDKYCKKHVKLKCNDTIIVNHYASDVEYNLLEFLDKNREKGNLEAFNFNFIEEKSNSSVISSFRASMNSLFDSINSTQIKYVRCIKPNNDKEAFVFDDKLVFRQLQATGVMETIKISRQLYSQEMVKERFFKRYLFAKGCLSKIGCSEGYTKIFMTGRILDGLEESRKLIDLRGYERMIRKFTEFYRNIELSMRKTKSSLPEICMFTTDESIIRDNDVKVAFLEENKKSFKKGFQDLNKNLSNIKINKDIKFISTKKQSTMINSPKMKMNKDSTLEIEKPLEDFTNQREDNDFVDIFLEGDYKNIEDPYEKIKILEEKLRHYQEYYNKPCAHCKKLEMKYKFQSEALKQKGYLDLELERYKNRVEELEKIIRSNEDSDDTFSFTSGSNLFGCLIEFYLEHVPTFKEESIPRSEILSFAHAAFKITDRVNKDIYESASVFMDEITLRLSSFERNMHKILFILSNLIEYKCIIKGENVHEDLDELISVLFKHMCELQKNTILEYLPHAIIEHQHLKNFRCNEGYLKKIFKPPSIEKLTKLLEYFYYQMEFYYLPEEYMIESVNYMLKNINTSVFNSLLIKKNFLSFNRGVQINFNLNEVDKFCRAIGYFEGTLNLGHAYAIIKLVNLCTARASADSILDQCSILNCMQIREILSKLDDPCEYTFGEDNKNDRFLPDPNLNIPQYKAQVKFNFVCPRFVPSTGLSSILKHIK